MLTSGRGLKAHAAFPESPAGASVILFDDFGDQDVPSKSWPTACANPKMAVFETVVSSKTHLLPTTIPTLFVARSGVTIVECSTNPGYFWAMPIGPCEMISEFAITELVSVVTAAYDVHSSWLPPSRMQWRTVITLPNVNIPLTAAPWTLLTCRPMTSTKLSCTSMPDGSYGHWHGLTVADRHAFARVVSAQRIG